MDKTLIARMNHAIARIGGPLSVLALPEPIKNKLTNCEDYETRVKMMEKIADMLGK